MNRQKNKMPPRQNTILAVAPSVDAAGEKGPEKEEKKETKEKENKNNDEGVGKDANNESEKTTPLKVETEPTPNSNDAILRELGVENLRDFASKNGFDIYDVAQQEAAKVILDDLKHKVDLEERQKKKK